MSQITQTYKRSFSGSVGAGLGAVFGTSGKQYYILEHKIASRYHRAGDTQDIIVDEIEIGRGAECQVRFDETFTTVSRRHAAIVRQGDKWKLIQLSNINPTLLNGNNVSHEWYLQSGDEIQLSIGGPKLGFIVPAGKTTGSIGLTRRLGLFANQALRPYKWAIALLSLALILAIGGLSAWKYVSDRDAQAKIVALEEGAKAQYDKFQAEQDSIAAVLQHTEKNLLQEKERTNKMRKDFEQRFQDSQRPPKEEPANTNPGQADKEEPANTAPDQANKEEPANISPGKTNNKAIDACLPYVYFVYTSAIEIIRSDGEKKYAPKEIGWTGTGFLLDDGRFVTARHVIEPWFFLQKDDTDMISLNLIAHNDGKIIVHFNAISSSGDKLSFTNEQIACNRSHDISGVTDDGLQYVFAKIDNTDWAYGKTSKTGGLSMDKAQSTTLERGTELTVLGFPFGLGANSEYDIKPVWSTAVTAMQGLNRGVILTTNTNYEHGNSGGPVFYTDSSGKLIVIGIVSASAGNSTGFIVPIAFIY
jgi:S1-C subfamily serine protease